MTPDDPKVSAGVGSRRSQGRPATNSDDPTKYRDTEEVEHWKQFDPIDRLEKYLRQTGALDDSTVAEVAEAAETLAASVRDAMNQEAEVDPRELFAHVYASPRTALAEQQQVLEAELAAAGHA